MDTVRIRNEIIRAVESMQDEEFLKMIRDLIKVYNADPVVGFDADQTLLTRSSLVRMVEEAARSVREGNSISQDEIERRSQEW